LRLLGSLRRPAGSRIVVSVRLSVVLDGAEDHGCSAYRTVPIKLRAAFARRNVRRFRPAQAGEIADGDRGRHSAQRGGESWPGRIVRYYHLLFQTADPVRGSRGALIDPAGGRAAAKLSNHVGNGLVVSSAG
jgi:hypothetical protein